MKQLSVVKVIRYTSTSMAIQMERHNKRTFIFPLLAAWMLYTTAAQADGPDIIGKWLVEDKTGIIEIFKCGEKYCGKTIWIKPSAEHPDTSKIVDSKNPDPKKRTAKIIGKTILFGLTYNADDKQWENGSIYNSLNGKTYSCKITMEGKDKLLLRGYIGISLIGQTTVWTRN